MKKRIIVSSIIVILTILILVSCRVIDGRVYRVIHRGEDFTVYKDVIPTFAGTDDYILLGDYDGLTYGFSSGTNFNKYKVIYEDEVYSLTQALNENIFSLEYLINEINLKEINGVETT